MKAINVRRFLDNKYQRAQCSSADWGGNNVWILPIDGKFIFEDDEHNFILLDRTFDEENEESLIVDLFVYRIGSGEIKNLML
jgi:hypothetical protein